MQHDPSPADLEKVVCTTCFAPAHKVVAMDAVAEPVCAICRSIELGGRARGLDMALEEIEAAARRLAFGGEVHPDDARAAFDEAAAQAARDRQTAGLRPCSTFAEVQDDIAALHEWDRLDWRDEEER